MDILVEQWAKWFPGVDMITMLGIFGIAIGLEHSRRVPDWVAVCIPLLLGGVVGFFEGMSTDLVGWGHGSQTLKGIIVNGGAASLFARLAHTKIAALFGYVNPEPPAT